MLKIYFRVLRILFQEFYSQSRCLTKALRLLLGGFDGVSRLDSVERYDPRMNTWVTVSPMLSCRDGLSMKQYGGWLYAVGGIDGPSYLNSVEYYDPLEDKWQETLQMKTSRAAAGVAVLPNLLDCEV